MKLLKLRPLLKGDTIGIFTPSWPGPAFLKEKYQHALDQIEKAGFYFREGFLTKNLRLKGYRSGTPQERAREFMELVSDKKVKCLMASIGGWNSSSLIPYLNFEEIRRQRKIICGYSDITALQMAILEKSKVPTIYGPCVIPTFGEYPIPHPFAFESFARLTQKTFVERIEYVPPDCYNRDFVDATEVGWKEREATRKYIENENWEVLCEGISSGPLLVANLETLLSLAGTEYFPELKNRILILEDEEAPLSQQERSLVQLKLMGVYEQISGLILSKPFFPGPEEDSFTYKDLVLEVVGKRNYPVIINFDCGHTYPSHSLPIGMPATVEAEGSKARFFLEESPLADEFLENT